MGIPNRGKALALEAVEKSSKNFRCTQPYEVTLIDLLGREKMQGNRLAASFMATAFHNVVKDFNEINGTTIMKKHVLSRIKTMKSHFILFHGAFKGLSGFSWNRETKMFDAEEYLWEHRIQENPKLTKFREKTCHNWDKLFELYGDIRATGDEASGMKEKSKHFKRGLEFADLCLESDSLNCAHFVANEASSYGDHEFSMDDGALPSTPEYGTSLKSDGNSRPKQKWKGTLIAVIEEGYKTMAAIIHELSMALVGTREKVAGAKFDVSQNSQILDALSELGLDEDYKVSCYLYLSSNPSNAAVVVAAPMEIRGKLLGDIMASAGV